jgi:hypothetical protein
MTDQLKEVLKNELQVADLFRGLKYLTFTHIDVYPSDEIKTVSDIDVLGIRFDDELMPTRIIVEVKGHGCKATDILKLYGLGEYFGNSILYFVTEHASMRCVKLARKLNVRVSSRSKLREILGPTPKRFVRSNPSEVRKTFSHLAMIKAVDSDAYWSFHHLWMERDPYLRLYQQQHLFSSSKEFASKAEMNEAATWFCKHLFIQSMVSVVEIASDCIALDPGVIGPFIEDRFFNLGTDRRSKEKIRNGVGKLVEVIDSLSGGEAKIPEIRLIPEYIPVLIDLVERILKSTKFIQQYLLRNYDVYLNELSGTPKNLSEVASRGEYRFISKFNDTLARLLHNGPISIEFNNYL